MKIIYYRKSNSEYQKGFFISLKFLTGILLFLGLILYHYLFTLEFSTWIIIGFLIIVMIPILYLIKAEEKTEINLDSSAYNGIDTYSYLRKKIKNKRGKPIKPNTKPVRIIGDYEFNAVIMNNKELLKFYEEALEKMAELTENGYDEIHFDKAQSLVRELIYKRDVLREIREIKKRI